MGMKLEEMHCYSQLDPEQQTQSVLPGAHPPVKGFYLIQPSSSVAPTRTVSRSASLLTRLRHPRSSPTTHSALPSSSGSQTGVEPDLQQGQQLDSSTELPIEADAGPEASTDVVVNIDETQATH